MHNAAFAALSLPHVYGRHRVAPADLRVALRDARRLGFGGLNLTVPLKEVALPLLDSIGPQAARIGAVNTLTFRGDRLHGDNTDAPGFLRSLGDGVRLLGAHVVVIGAGGSARAVGDALVEAGSARITLLNRTAARADALAERLARAGRTAIAVAPFAALETGEVLGDASLIVNTTSVGLSGAGMRVRYGASPRQSLFVDLVYGATPFLAAAARAGRRTLDGAGMLLHQGALAFETWTGRRAPLAAMSSALRSAGLALPRPRGARTVRRRSHGST